MSVKDETLLAYLDVRSVSSSQVIPNKDKFTFISKLNSVPEAWLIGNDGKPGKFGEFKDRVMSVHHSPLGDQSVIGIDDKGNEKQQLFLFTHQDNTVTPLVYEPDFFHHFGGWSADGKQIAFSSNRRHPGYFDLFVQDVATKEVRTILEHDGNCVPLKWVPDGEHLLINIPETNIDQAVYLLNIHTGKQKRVGEADVLARYQSIELTNDSQTGFVLTDAGEETTYISQFSLEQPEKMNKVFHEPKWDIDEIKLSPDEALLACSLNEGGVSRLYIWDVAKRHMTEAEAPEGVIHSLAWLNEDKLIFTLNTPTMPGDVFSYTLSNEQILRKTNISKSEKVETLWVEPTLCSFASFDGLTVPYFYYENETSKNKPVVIYVHGGPESQTRAEFNPVIQYLVHKGFAVAAPNVRGSRGYGRTYIQLDDAQKRMDSVKDLSWLLKDLVKTHHVDEDKVGIIGRSYGGFMVLAALTHYPHLWAAGVNIVGMSNLRTFLENTGPWRRRLREFEYGTLEHDSEFLEETAPLNHSDKITAPLLVFHGRNDTRVPVSEAEQLVKDLQKRNQVVDFTVFEDEGHQTERIENHITMNRDIVDFFNTHLKK